MRGKSGRKALRDVSNDNRGRTSSKFATSAEKKETDCSSKLEEQDDSLDRLLLLQSDLSALIRNVDELVVQAFKLNEIGKDGRKEIESFTHVLSDMLSSLKPWVPRFQKALSYPLADSHDNLEQSLASKSDSVPVVNETENDALDSPHHTEVQAMVSPSPLVSWRAGCNIERGRQLFLLTPLPMSKSLSSKHLEYSKLVFDGMSCGKVDDAQTCLIARGDSILNLLEGKENESCPGKPSGSDLTEVGITRQHGPASPLMSSKKNCSVLVMTPSVKMSPPKSCVLLEPISESSHEDGKRHYKATPFPVGIHHNFSGSDSSDGLAMKFPELLGIQQANNKSGIRKKAVEASPDWFMSPPKTCVLLEPSDSHSVDDGIDAPATDQVLNSQLKSSLTKGINDLNGYHATKKHFCCQDPDGTSLPHTDSTPMWKECESVMRVGKRAGEETLKKELWVKFEAAAATANPFRSNRTPKEASKKGFLELLDEASCDIEF